VILARIENLANIRGIFRVWSAVVLPKQGGEMPAGIKADAGLSFC
jgi:hypothetical protein